MPSLPDVDAPERATATALHTTTSTCCYCGVGCGVLIESTGGRIVGVRGDPQHPANFGRLCSKGNSLHKSATDAVVAQARLLRPMLRMRRGVAPEALGWDTAMDFAAERVADIVQQHGSDAIGFYVSGQFLTEDYYVFNKLVKGLLQTNNIDSNSRLCMSSAVAGYKRTLGADAPPACYDDIAHAATLFFAGANSAYAHPILFRRVEDAKRANPRLRIIVADPRRTDTAEIADLFLPIAPGSDVALFHGMLHVLLAEARIDPAFIAAHTVGFDALSARVRDFPARTAAEICGIAEADLVRAARWFAQGPTLSLYCQGLNQSVAGTAKNAALINLHLATGQIGKPGAGPLSLTGQPNAMGGRETGTMANLASAHRDLGSVQDRGEIARLWGIDSVPAKPGLTAVEMFDAAASGSIKALWIACSNPAQSLPDQGLVRRALERAEFVVLQEAFATTATAAYADLLLPAAAWGEKEGTVTNSERRISRVRAAVPPPGEARADWRIGVDLARRLELRLRPGKSTLFAYETPESVWNEHRESTRGRDLDITGLCYAMLETAGPQQWPFPEGASEGRTRLYADALFPTPDGRARFADVEYQPVAEARDARYPFSLITGRLRDQWHGMSRTGTIPQLFGHVPEPAIELHPKDMTRLKLADGDLVRVRSRRGEILIPARTSEQVARTHAFLPMHWGEEFLGGSHGVNTLTLRAFCPSSKQPELKHAAVDIARAELPWRLLAMAWLPPERVLAAQRTLRAAMTDFPFSVCVPFGSDPAGVLFRAAALLPPPLPILERIERLLELDSGELLRYIDPGQGHRRIVRLHERKILGFLLGGDTSSEAWMRELLQQRAPVDEIGVRLLRPGSTPPGVIAPRSRQVCSCFDVSEAAIQGALAQIQDGSPEQRLAELQRTLRCGTNCGSCVPELQRLVRNHGNASADSREEPSGPPRPTMCYHAHVT